MKRIHKYSRRGFQSLLDLKQMEIFEDSAEVNLEEPSILAVYFKTQLDEIKDEVRFMYYKKPNATEYPLDLKAGFSYFVPRQTNELFDNLVYLENYLLKSAKDVLATDASKKATTSYTKQTTILTKRGVLTQIMNIPYILDSHKRGDLQFHAIKYGGLICLINPTFPSKAKTDLKEFIHYKFQQFCFTNKFNEEPDTKAAINNNEWNFGIYGTMLNHFNLIYSGEFSGILSDHEIKATLDINTINKLRFVMTKTMDAKMTGKNNFKNRIWWLQAFLAHVDDIFVAKREFDGLVRSPVQHQKAQDLLKICDLNPLVCFRFLNKFLTLVETTMADVDCPYTVYQFQYNSQYQTLKYRIRPGKTQFSFLSEELIEYLKKRNAK